MNRTTRIYYGADLYWTVPYVDAKRDVRINGSLMDAMNGKPGVTIGCHMSNCVMRNNDSFPHPVHLASFTASTCYVIDKITGGAPKHAVKYKHGYGFLVDLNDAKANKALKDNPELVEREFVLKKPNPPRIGQSKNTTGTRSGVKRAYVPKGALRRAINAGLITANLPKKQKV